MIKACVEQRSGCIRLGVLSIIAQTYDLLGIIQRFLLLDFADKFCQTNFAGGV